jgi:hypothetical protein
MIRRFARFALVLGALGLVLSSCRTAGVRYVIMALDTQGQQPRNVFYTDSTTIDCVAIASASNPDTTIDFVVRQDTSTDQWMYGSNIPVGLPSTDIFSAGEVTVMPGMEEAEALQIPSTGIMSSIMCYGYCRQNAVGSCDNGFTDEGPDSCGPDATCCYQFGAEQASTTNMQFPFPVGHFECDVTINGDDAGSAQFDIEYPPTNCPTVPASTGQPCYGWVPPGSVCPGISDFCCTCQGSQQVATTDPSYGTWVCTELPASDTTCPP